MDDEKHNDDGGDDEEKMRRAFEAFMLTGKNADASHVDESSSHQTTSNRSKKKKKKKKSSLGGTSPSVTPPKKNTPSGATPTSSKRSAAKSKGEKKRYYQLLRSFDDKVLRWLDLDDEMLSVLQNVVSIRGRLPVEWKLLNNSSMDNNRHDGSPDPEEEDDDEEEWKYHGFQGKPKEIPYSSFHMRTHDVRLALINDATQHERMLGALRSLVSELAERHDGLGRLVDSLWKFHQECSLSDGGGNGGWEVGGDRGTNDEEEDDMERMVECKTDVYRMLSMELYRKQGLVRVVLESTQDDMLGIEDARGRQGVGETAATSGMSAGNDGGGGTLNSLLIARQCRDSWKRTSEGSCIDEGAITNSSRPREEAA